MAPCFFSLGPLFLEVAVSIHWAVYLGCLRGGEKSKKREKQEWIMGWRRGSLNGTNAGPPR